MTDDPQEVLRTARSIADAVKATAEAVKPLTEVLAEVVRPSARRAGEWLDRRTTEWLEDLFQKRERNRAGVVGAALEQARREGLEEAEADKGTVLRCLELAQDVDDADLWQCWAHLIVSSAEERNAPHPRFLHVLAMLSGDDARWFARCVERARRLGVTAPLPVSYREFWRTDTAGPEHARLESLDLVANQVPSTDHAEAIPLPSALGWQFATAVLSPLLELRYEPRQAREGEPPPLEESA